ncbi:MAG: indolepyruvate ferredoxin oxidoreductase subunit alpha, partial [Candidatus Thermoplasmatota archaeon]
MKELLEDDPGKEILLLGNEAIVRGALEAGVGHGSTYPGTPSSEIGNTFEKIAKDYGMYFEYSANEKVALETAAAAAVSGVRSMA